VSTTDLDIDALVESATEGLEAPPELGPEQRLARAGLRRLDVAAMLAEPPPPYNWLWDGYLEAGELTWIVGKGKTGKSLVALFAAAAMLEGRPFLGLSTKRITRVAYVDGENREATVRRRLHACGLSADLAPHLDYYAARGLDLGSPAGLDALRLVAHGVDLVVLDSLVALHTGDENDAVATRRLVTGIRSVLEEAGATGVGLAHEKHGGGLRGSTDWTNSVDRTLYLDKDAAGYRTLRPGDVRDGDENVAPVVFRFALEAGTLHMRAVGGSHGRPQVDRGDLAEMIAGYLTSHPGASMRETAKALGTTHDARPFRDAWKVSQSTSQSGAKRVGPDSGAERVGPGGATPEPDTLPLPMDTGETGGAEKVGPEPGPGWGRKGGGALKGPTPAAPPTPQALREQTLGEP
jgi:hypothetical protein